MAEIVTKFTLSDLVSITGMKRRTVQLWAEAGVIQSDASTERAGTGVHRQFSWREAKVACLLSPLCDLQLPIGKMLELSKTMRDGGDANLPNHPLINGMILYRSSKPSLRRLHEASNIVMYDNKRGAFLAPA